MKKINKADLQYLIEKAKTALEAAVIAREAAITEADNKKIEQFLNDHLDFMSVKIDKNESKPARPVVHMSAQVEKRYKLLTEATSRKSHTQRYSIGGLYQWYQHAHDDVHAWLKPKVEALDKLSEELRFGGSAEGLNQINDFIKSLAPAKGAPAKVRKIAVKKVAVKKTTKAATPII